MVRYIPGISCADIYHKNVESQGRSRDYWVTDPSLHTIYCDMELECGSVEGGWTRIAYFNATQGHSCPPPWRRVALPGSRGYACKSPSPRGCHSLTFSTHDRKYNKICGRVRGYQKGNFKAIGGETYTDPLIVTMLTEYQ